MPQATTPTTGEAVAMSRYTRQMLIKAFAELAQERPLNRINVSEIVSRCAVHRNTFYYYFDDIHHLVNQFLEEEKTRLSALSESAGSWEEAISIFVNYASENRKILKKSLSKTAKPIKSDGRKVNSKVKLMHRVRIIQQDKT